MIETTLLTLRSIIISHTPGASSSNAPKSPNPAAFTRYFTLGLRASSSFLRESTPSLFERSAVITRYFTPRLSPRAIILSFLRATSQSSSTRPAYPFANSAPMPLDAPVIIATVMFFSLNDSYGVAEGQRIDFNRARLFTEDFLDSHGVKSKLHRVLFP